MPTKINSGAAPASPLLSPALSSVGVATGMLFPSTDDDVEAERTGGSGDVALQLLLSTPTPQLTSLTEPVRRCEYVLGLVVGRWMDVV